MEFITFPIRVGGNGGLSRSKDRSAGLMQVLGVIAGTPRAGWCGSEHFGARDLLREFQRRADVRLIVIKEINQALEDLGIDWVCVSDIEREPAGERGIYSYLFTLSYPGQGSEVQLLNVDFDG